MLQITQFNAPFSTETRQLKTLYNTGYGADQCLQLQQEVPAALIDSNSSDVGAC